MLRNWFLHLKKTSHRFVLFNPGFISSRFCLWKHKTFKTMKSFEKKQFRWQKAEIIFKNRDMVRNCYFQGRKAVSESNIQFTVMYRAGPAFTSWQRLNKVLKTYLFHHIPKLIFWTEIWRLLRTLEYSELIVMLRKPVWDDLRLVTHDSLSRCRRALDTVVIKGWTWSATIFSQAVQFKQCSAKSVTRKYSPHSCNTTNIHS